MTELREKRFIGFFDILGFKNLIKSKDLDWQIQLFINDLDSIVSNAVSPSFRAGDPCGKPLREYLAYQINFSDTFLLYSLDDSPKSLQLLVEASNRLIFHLLPKGIAIRGAITFGEVYIRLNETGVSILGAPIAYAAELESKQEWCGGVVSQEIFELPPYKKALDKLRDLKRIIPYNVPTKNGDAELLALEWPVYYTGGFQGDDPDIKKLMQSNYAEEGISEGVIRKIENTETFLKHCIERDDLPID